ncbi:MAG: LUD domain-containing protein, partial [Burkholderiales bacterium]
IQLAHETPSHIIAPAVHKSKQQIVDLFKKFGVILFDGGEGGAPGESIETLTAAARVRLRGEFLNADAGISGANFLVAETGHLVIVENEGNARLTTTCPRVHIAVAGIEKILPKLEDLWVFLTLLPRSATGQMITTYVSFLKGPKKEFEPDGPQEFHLVLLDNGRNHMRHDPLLRETLMCIRCGACLNFCPVYQTVGGHAYGWVYSGPIGAITTPQMRGLDAAGQLPYASSLCSACADVCPVKIPIPEILLKLRQERVERKSSFAERVAFRVWRLGMTSPALYDFGSRLVRIGAWFFPFMRTPGLPRGIVDVNLPLADDWLKTRDLPPIPSQRFRDIWKKL